MSQENVESVLTMWAASMEGDPAELDLSLLAEDIVYEDDILPDHGSETYHGDDGIRRAWARAIEPFEDAENVVEWTRRCDVCRWRTRSTICTRSGSSTSCRCSR